MIDKRKRIALIIPGGIATGKANIGVPVLERLVRLLSGQFDITVFSLFRTNEDFFAGTFELVDVSATSSIMKFSRCYNAFHIRHKNRPFDIVHGFWAMPSGFLSVLIGKRYGIKSIVSILGGDAISLPEINYGQLQRWLPRKLILWTLEYSDEVITLTRYLRDNLLKIGMKQRKVNVIPWGIDVSMFVYRAKPLSSPIAFLHVANLHPVKDQFTLLRAFRIITKKTDARLKIIGEGILSKQIRKLTSELGLVDKVEFMDPLPYDQLPQHYAKADVLLHTSLSEGQSEVVTEAMSSGIVVCGTRVGLMYDEPDLCLSVDVSDHEALATGVLKLLENPDQFKDLREKAHDWAVQHDIHWTARMYGSLYS